MSIERGKPRLYVFYAGLLHSEHWSIFPRLEHLGQEVYNGCWVWVAYQWSPASVFEKPGWYRGDKTRYPTEQVPAELRALALLLT